MVARSVGRFAHSALGSRLPVGERLATKRRGDKFVAPATINRELAALKRAFKLAVEQKRLSTTPVIKLLAENNIRQGFVEPPLFKRMAAGLPEPLDDIAWLAYLSGWRKSEITTLEWADVDREGRRVTLRRERSKTGEPRVLPLIDELVEIIDRRWRARECTYKDGGTALSRYVFHRSGQRVAEFRSPGLRRAPQPACPVCSSTISGARVSGTWSEVASARPSPCRSPATGRSRCISDTGSRTRTTGEKLSRRCRPR